MLWFSHVAASIGGPDVWTKPITDPVFVEALKVVKKMYDSYSHKDSIGAAAAVPNGHFLNQETAMYTNGSWRLAPTAKDGAAFFDTLEFGYMPAFGKYTNGIPYYLQSMLTAGETKDPKRRAAIISFLKFMTMPDNVKKLSLSSGAMFTIKFDFTPSTPVEKGIKRFMDLVNNASFIFDSMETALGPAAVAEFGQQLGKLALGQTTEIDMLKAIQKKMDF